MNGKSENLKTYERLVRSFSGSLLLNIYHENEMYANASRVALLSFADALGEEYKEDAKLLRDSVVDTQEEVPLF